MRLLIKTITRKQNENNRLKLKLKFAVVSSTNYTSLPVKVHIKHKLDDELFLWCG